MFNLFVTNSKESNGCLAFARSICSKIQAAIKAKFPFLLVESQFSHRRGGLTP